jgi:hypothetical protein
MNPATRNASLGIRTTARQGSVVVAACLAVAIACGGCGRQYPEIIPVRGTATFDGRPIVMMDVVFDPLSGTRGSGSIGRTGTDGRFEMQAIVGGATRVLKGARPGRYRVVFAEPEWYSPEGMPLPRPPGAGPVVVPSVYMNATESPLEVEVTKGMPDVVLELKSK